MRFFTCLANMEVKVNLENVVDREFRGCCLITKRGENLFERAYGYADFANKVPNTVETKFATASAGKVFVAVAILQLIEKEVLSFDDRLGDLLDLELNMIDPEITIKQLLTHTSGIPDYFDESVMDDYEELWRDFPNYKIRKNSDLLPLFIYKPMMYSRGEKFQYNNTGYVVLAMIIEQITGVPFDKYIKLNIFDICRMKETGYYELDRLPAKCANNYIFDEDCNEFRTNIYSVDAKGTGAGGAFTTVGDIKLFWTYLMSDKLLSAEMTRVMLDCQSGNREDGYYGYGVWIKKIDNNNSPYFQGCDPGVSFISVYEPNEKIVITLVSNYGDNVWKIIRNIRECILVKE